jgi:hypothetical protein
MDVMKVSYLDCCSGPDLESVKTILDTNRERESLCRCKTCGVYWFHRFLEIFMSDDQTVWYSRVTEEEAQHILKTEGRPDLKFLLNRSSFREDAGGVRRVSGQPDEPCYG